MNTQTQTIPDWETTHARVAAVFQSLAPGFALDGLPAEVGNLLIDAADKLREAILRAHGERVRKPQARNPATMAEIRVVVVDLLHADGLDGYNLRTDSEIIALVEKRTGKTTTRQTLAKCDYHHHARQLRGEKRDRQLYTQSGESVL